MGLIFGLSLQQLVSGIALAVAIGTSPFWGLPPSRGLDPHLLLATLMNTLAVQTGVITTAIILWDERPNYVTKIRGGMGMALSLITILQNLNVYTTMGYDMPGVAAAIAVMEMWATLPVTFAFMNSFMSLLTTALVSVSAYYRTTEEQHERRNTGRAEHHERRSCRSSSRTFAWVMAVNGSILSPVSFAAVVFFKFGPSTINCNLNDPAENVLTFGQITSIALLVAPPMTVIDAIYCK